MVLRLLHRPEHEAVPTVLPELDKKLGQKIQRRQDKMGRPIDTRQGGSNMPRYQPCPSCHRGTKRKRKTVGGAHYYCKRCKAGFFVRAQ